MLKNSVDKFKKVYDKSVRNYLLFFTLTILSISVASAAGVSTPYWNTNPLKLGPGESIVFSLGLQNMVGDENITLRANLTKGYEIARIIDANTDYFVPIGSSDDVKVNIEVKIPENAELGKVYGLEASFLQVSGGGGGGFFSVASAFTQRIPVEVVGETTESAVYGQKPSKNYAVYMVLALVILGIILVAVNIKKRRR